MRALFLVAICFTGLFVGCEGDYQGTPGQQSVEVKQTPDLRPETDHDIQINTPDVDVDINKNPGGLPDVNVDVLKTPDRDTRANQPD